MVISPGYGISDIAWIINTAAKIHNAYKDAPGEFHALSVEVKTLQSALEEFALRLQDGRLNDETRIRAANLLSESRTVLENLNSLLKRYKGLATDSKSPFDRVLFGQKDTQKLRERMRFFAAAIQGLQTETLLRKTDTISTQVEQILDKLVQDKTNENTLGSTPWTDFADPTITELEKRGITMEYMRENTELIVDSIVYGVENQRARLQAHPPASRPRRSAPHEDRSGTQPSDDTLHITVADPEGTTQIPGAGPDTDALNQVPTTPAEDGTDLKESILHVVTKRLQHVGSSSVAHDGSPPDPPSHLAPDGLLPKPPPEHTGIPLKKASTSHTPDSSWITQLGRDVPPLESRIRRISLESPYSDIGRNASAESSPVSGRPSSMRSFFFKFGQSAVGLTEKSDEAKNVAPTTTPTQAVPERASM